MTPPGRPLEVLCAAVRAKLVCGERVKPSLLWALDGINPGWRGHDDLWSITRSLHADAAYSRPDDDTGGHQPRL